MLTKIKREPFPETDGEMQRRLESALEALSRAWGEMLHEGTVNDGELRTWPPSGPQEQGTVAYYLAMGIRRAWEVDQGMRRLWGTTEGQLCPWEDCLHHLAFPDAGWYTCGNCGRLVFAEVCEGDFEDYHAYKPSDRYPAPSLVAIPVARNLGSSWAIPKKGGR